MAAPNYEQIQSFGNVNRQLVEAAISKFQEYLYDGITREEVIDIAVGISTKYSMLGSELGAQWYDLCTELAGIDADPAMLSSSNIDSLESRANSYADKFASDESKAVLSEAFNTFLQNEINNSIRTTGNANLWRDYERGLTPGKWARVPVGDTCAWCLMLASQGAWYLTEKSALGESAGHYHDDCNCVAVYHATPESIAGYTKLGDYKSTYYEAENMRIANASGKQPYNEELQARIDAAKAEHQKRFDNGDTDKPWTRYNETLIVMRYNDPALK